MLRSMLSPASPRAQNRASALRSAIRFFRALTFAALAQCGVIDVRSDLRPKAPQGSRGGSAHRRI